MVLFGFHNSLNTNPKRSGTSDSILTFQQFAWILSWFCLASFLQLLVLFGFHNSLNIQIRSGAEHRISFLPLSSLHGFSPGFVRLLSYSSWFCLASTTRLIQIRSEAEHRISFLPLSSLYGFSPGLVRLLSYSSWFCLASTTRLIQIRSGAEHRIPFLHLSSLHGSSPGFV